MAKVVEMVLSTLMPMSRAAPGSSEQALMALPILVLAVNRPRATMMTTEHAMVTMVSAEMVSRPSKSTTCGQPATTDVKTRGLEPQMSSARFCSRYDTPMAVMSTVRLGDWRKGL